MDLLLEHIGLSIFIDTTSPIVQDIKRSTSIPNQHPRRSKRVSIYAFDRTTVTLPITFASTGCVHNFD